MSNHMYHKFENILCMFWIISSKPIWHDFGL